MRITKAHIDHTLYLIDPDDIDIRDLSKPDRILSKIFCKAYDAGPDLFADQHEGGDPDISLDFVVSSHSNHRWLTLCEGEDVPNLYPDLATARRQLLIELDTKVQDAKDAIESYANSIKEQVPS